MLAACQMFSSLCLPVGTPRTLAVHVNDSFCLSFFPTSESSRRNRIEKPREFEDPLLAAQKVCQDQIGNPNIMSSQPSR